MSTARSVLLASDAQGTVAATSFAALSSQQARPRPCPSSILRRSFKAPGRSSTSRGFLCLAGCGVRSIDRIGAHDLTVAGSDGDAGSFAVYHWFARLPAPAAASTPHRSCSLGGTTDQRRCSDRETLFPRVLPMPLNGLPGRVESGVCPTPRGPAQEDPDLTLTDIRASRSPLP